MPHARLAGSEDALVARSEHKVEIRRLAEGGARFILALQEGRTIGEAAILALGESSAFDLKAISPDSWQAARSLRLARLQAVNETLRRAGPD